jgi:hypothetical protein
MSNVGLTVEQVVSARPDKATRLPGRIAADPAVVARIAEVEAQRATVVEAVRNRRG